MPYVQAVRVSHSFYLVVAVTTFSISVILYLVAISATSWQGIQDGIYISLWKVCVRYAHTGEWHCDPWHIVPDFIRSSQAFCIITLLCYFVSSAILIISFFVRAVQRSKVILIILSLMTFTSACMIVMAVLVVGVKGKDHLFELKQDNETIFQYFLKGVVLSGNYQIGWSLILAVIAALINFLSFIFFLLEYKDITAHHAPVKV